ncbi:MAG: type II toxin-antitoxin system RatA family toxin [Robiginitomaculum sp.]|nr:type II toxin-antitoxin system RatA family toxin [Robiginitomaculum sp.]
MARHHIWKRVAFSPDDVFTLASDIGDYPNFIKFISAIRIKDDYTHEGIRTLLAEVRIRYQFIRERFSTHVYLNAQERTVEVKLARGPFRKLKNSWRIHPLDDGSSFVEFKVDYELDIPFLSHLLKSKEDRAAASIMRAFERRAAERFQSVGGPDEDVEAQIAAIKSL